MSNGTIENARRKLIIGKDEYFESVGIILSDFAGNEIELQVAFDVGCTKV